MDNRFKTKTNMFSKDYAQNASLQKGFNQQLVTDIVQYILRTMPQAKPNPISILDLCCGDGGTTNELLKELDKHGIKVNKIVGLDISPEQIQVAQTYSQNDPRLQFNVDNIETMKVSETYDVVISLFGLHWMENLPKTAKCIAESTKEDGHIMFFVPLEKNELFQLRHDLISSPEWKDIFKDFTISPFIDDGKEYLETFVKYYKAENTEGISGDQPVYFTEERFIKFLSSWMQEVRFLLKKDKNLADKYLNQLIKCVPQNEQLYPDVKLIQLDNQTHIQFIEKFFWFHGTKKDLAVRTADVKDNLATLVV